MLDVLRQFGYYPLGNKDILEVGCGSGGVLQEFVSFGTDPERLQGVDL